MLARRPIGLLLLGAIGGIVSMPASARACATCAVGDPTLTVMGAEQPFAHRVRGALFFRYRTDRLGEPGVNAIDLSEERIEASVSYSPTTRYSLSLSIPTVHRRVSYVNGAEDALWSLGDMELRFRAFVYRDSDRAPRHLLATLVGIQLPTAPLDRDSNGQVLPLELQAGSGSFNPIAGLTYGFFADPWSFSAVSAVVVGTPGRADVRVGTSWRTTLRAQLQPWSAVGFLLGADLRLDGRTLEGGETDPDSGGFIAYLTGGLVVSPATDLILSATVSYPTINALYGHHEEGLALAIGCMYDF